MEESAPGPDDVDADLAGLPFLLGYHLRLWQYPQRLTSAYPPPTKKTLNPRAIGLNLLPLRSNHLLPLLVQLLLPGVSATRTR